MHHGTDGHAKFLNRQGKQIKTRDEQKTHNERLWKPKLLMDILDDWKFAQGEPRRQYAKKVVDHNGLKGVDLKLRKKFKDKYNSG